MKKMSMENKTNVIMAVRGYKTVKKEKNANFTDVTALDNLNKKVLLRIIEPLRNEYIDINDVRNMTQLIQRETFDYAILLSRKFTDKAVNEMIQQKIEHVSDDHMPPFDIEKLYSAILYCVNSQCEKKCGEAKSDCSEKKAAILCKIRPLAENAKAHFEEGLVGLLKNDLKVALALNK